jgi:pimeloyl-ACP methyl ester carboxylesterase
MIPVNINYDNYVFNSSQWEDNYGLTDFLSIAMTRASAGYPPPLAGPKTASGTYQIAASFCTPKEKSEKAKTVIIATHGIGPARAHWNSPYKPDEYNFVQHAIGQGYSVFFYDRLGCGASEKYAPNFRSLPQQNADGILIQSLRLFNLDFHRNCSAQSVGHVCKGRQIHWGYR